MREPLNTTRLGIVGLILLVVITVALSGAALVRHRPVTATPANPGSSAGGRVTSTAPSSVPAGSSAAPSSASAAASSTSSAAQSSRSPAAPSTNATGGPTVVILGDANSIGDATWVSAAAQELGWGNVVNLSSAGRGYLAVPGQCDFAPCTRFIGTIPVVVKSQPDVVVTFGGVADGDFSITAPAANYYRALRTALPNAKIVAISPVTTESTAPFWLTLHSRSIRDGVEAVGGTFVDVGQPALGSGKTLSEQAHSAIAAQVIKRLS